MCKLDLGKAEEPEIKLPASVGSSKKARDFQKDIYFCFIDYAKACDCVDHNKLWEILQEMGIQDYLSCLWALPKSSLHIWKFSVHILLKSSLENFEHHLVPGSSPGGSREFEGWTALAVERLVCLLM